MRILVIDDDPDVRLLLRDALEAVGHEVLVAENGREGLEVHQRGPVDLVLVDLLMPEKDGIETIADLRSVSPDVPIIAMSGGGRVLPTEKYLSLARQIGADLVLRKPFDTGALLTSVAKALQRRQG